MNEKLFIKFLNGECTLEEEQQVRQWAQEQGGAEELEAWLARRWEKVPSATMPDSKHYPLLDKIHARMSIPVVQTGTRRYQQEGASGRSYHSLLVAASLALALLVTGVYMYFAQPSEEAPIAQSIPAITKKTNVGEKLTLQLPDGSRVILNASSQITYPSRFTDSTRSVRLSGEAFLEVTHNDRKPFKVLTKNTETTVLGTQFNVNSRQEEAITLVEGSVQVTSLHHHHKNTVRLSPGQMVYTTADVGELQVEAADLKEITAWKDGVLVFKGITLGEITTKLENWYGVEITVDQGVSLNTRVSGEFNNENLHNILKGLSFSLDFAFTITDKEVIIKPN